VVVMKRPAAQRPLDPAVAAAERPLDPTVAAVVIPLDPTLAATRTGVKRCSGFMAIIWCTRELGGS
jgi:hypothetical protein